MTCPRPHRVAGCYRGSNSVYPPLIKNDSFFLSGLAPGVLAGTVGMGSQRLTTRPPRLLFEHVSATVFMFKSLRQPILLRLL